jgi:hypothetical protein
MILAQTKKTIIGNSKTGQETHWQMLESILTQQLMISIEEDLLMGLIQLPMNKKNVLDN